MRVTLEWTPESRTWLETMPSRMDAAMRKGAERGAMTAARSGRVVARLTMARFESWARNDLHVARGSWNSDGTLFETFIGFVGDRTLVGDPDTHKYPAPFSYPAAKHTPGAEPHKVWLFSASGVMSEHRRKLIRWLKLHGTGYDWGLLPDAPEKELWNKSQPEGFPPPFVKVDPSSSATDYFDRLIANDGDPMATWLIDRFWPFVKRAWEAVA